MSVKQFLDNVYRLGIKELFSLRRDLILVFLIVYSFSYGVYTPAKNAAFGMINASVGIVDEDRSALSLRIRDVLRAPYFLEPGTLAVHEIDRAMDSAQFTFVIDIPPNFEADIKRGRQPEMQIVTDATAMTQAGTGVGYIQSIVMQEVAALTGARAVSVPPAVNLVMRTKFNPNLESASFMAVMQIINNITMLSIVLTGAALIREREHGTIEHLLVMPVTPFEIMTSKVWAMALVVLVASAVAINFIVEGLLGVPIQGSVGLFLLGALLHLFATTSLGIFLGTFARSMPQFGLLVILVLLPLEMLSGGMTPRESMPAAVRDLMLLAPTTHFVMLAQSILYRGAGLDVVWRDFAAAAVLGVLFVAGALSRFRKTLAE
jgi:ABC-2 type transport system permease protein